MMADRILMYHSLPDELSTRDFLGKWSGRKHFFLPRVNGVNLDILPYEQTRLHLGAFEIEEPDGNDLTDIADIELIIVLGCGLRPPRQPRRARKRILRPDACLPRATKVGVGYDFQLIDDAIDTDSHDVPVDIVITQSHTVIRRR